MSSFLSFQVSFTPTNQVIASGYAYDADGNMTGNGTYTYDGENRLSHAATGGTGTNYYYDADGKRSLKDRTGNRIRKDAGGTNVTEYIYFGGEPIAERDAAGNWT